MPARKKQPIYRMAAEDLEAYVTAIVRAMGSDETEARLVVRHLIEANLTGHDSHGISMLPSYKRSIDDGNLKLGGAPKILKDDGPVLLFDGENRYGQMVAHVVTETAIERAKKHGFAIVGLRNAHHIGRIGHWGGMCAAAGLISIHYVNGTAAMFVAPHGGSDRRFLTNPYCTAIPGVEGQPPVVFDMATSQIAMGKVRVAYHAGKPVPDGALIDHRGRPTNDPAVMYEPPFGALLPVGGHKGYGLAMICDLLAGSLTGGGSDLPERNMKNNIINNMLMIVLRPDLFADRDAVLDDMKAFRSHVQSSPAAPGVEAVLVPGDPERNTRVERLRDGVPIDGGTWDEVAAVARAVGVTVPNTPEPI